jgi:DNA-binding MurR/RpiR family transcriptional regulator
MDGYPQFRAELVRGFEATLAPVENLRQELERGDTVADVFAAVFEENQRNIEATRRSLQPEACERAVAAILRARRIYIIGFGASAWLGGLLQRGLDPYCDHVELLAGMGGASFAARKLFKLRADDLMIAIAFPRYVADTIYLSERARERGVPVLALTDRPTSPLAPNADISLYASTESNYSANSEATVLSLIEALCVAVTLRAQGSLKAAANVAEFVMPWLHGSGTPAERTQSFTTSARSRRDALDTQNS